MSFDRRFWFWLLVIDLSWLIPFSAVSLATGFDDWGDAGLAALAAALGFAAGFAACLVANKPKES